jgi:hypothetical protein
MAVTVYLKRGDAVEIGNASSVKASRRFGGEEYASAVGLACEDAAGEVVAEFYLADVAGYKVKPASEQISAEAFAKTVVGGAARRP